MYTPQYQLDDLEEDGKKIIDSFAGEYEYLSNFYPVQIFFRGHWYPTVENAFQSQKDDDEFYQLQFRTSAEILYFHQCINGAHIKFDHIKIYELTPGQAKRAGRKCELKKDWEKIKVPLMDELVDIKFNNPILEKRLLQTDDAILIEGNTWDDQFWGVCGGVGLNMLGKSIMKARRRRQFFKYVYNTDIPILKVNYEKKGKRI
jgi:predicted NAD-dependent protein-ADP-ribosyltransferase YbiA (DUF1768 family)